MECPWCGDEVTTEEYSKHLEYCKKYPPNYEAIKERARIHSSNPREIKQPTMKELLKGKVLNGYLEASQVRTLEQFMPFTFLFDEGLPTEEKITVNAINSFEAETKARDEFTKRRGTPYKTSRLVG